MDKYVTSRELAEKLKEAGYPQETQFSWDWFEHGEGYNQYEVVISPGLFAAPITDELLEQLPKLINGNQFLSLSYPINLWVASYVVTLAGRDITKLKDMVTADKPTDALAELWLYCKENGYVTPQPQEEQ